VHTSNGRIPAPENPKVRIEVFTIALGVPYHVRMLSGEVSGLFFHWKRGGGTYCDPGTCCTEVPRPGRTWLGFVAAEVYDRLAKLWRPTCFPISERLELDLRHRYRRGQTWLIEQGKPIDKKNQPVRGKLVDEANPTSFPAAFQILPVIRTIYHAPHAELGQKNPMPDIVLVEASNAPPPKGLVTSDEPIQRMSAEEHRALIEKQNRELAERLGVPSTNGKR